MFGLDIAHTLELLTQWGYPVIFVLAVIEGPVVMMLGGAVVSFGHFNWLCMLVVLVLADIVGDSLYYALGRYGHGPIGMKIARWLRITEEREKKIEHAFHQHGGKILLFTKTQAIGSVALYAAGAVRMPFWRYIWFNLIGTIPKTALFQAAGFYLANSYRQFEQYLGWTALGMLLISVALIGLYFLFKSYLQSKDAEFGL